MSELRQEEFDVRVAFESLLEEVEDIIDAINEKGADALKQGEYDTARLVMATGERLADFRQRLRQMQAEWEELRKTVLAPYLWREGRPTRLKRGLRTPEERFRGPLLEVLAELGGSGTAKEVTDRVGERMRDELNEYDLLPVGSMPNNPRWRNTVAWCRVTLVREGLLRDDSPRGRWELTDAGWREVERLRAERGATASSEPAPDKPPEDAAPECRW